ncbi:MAG: hypothetical protein AAGA48_12735 [Myxococcota bacterium]
MWVTLAMTVGACAEPVDDERAQALVDDLVPVVEARAERTFVRPPRAALTTRDRLRQRLLRPPALAVALEGDRYTPSPETRRFVEHLLAGALAVYVPHNEFIYLVTEAFDELREDFELEPRTLEPLLQCVLLHEMVHALQHQYGVEVAKTPETQLGQQALREGHASWLANEYCAVVHGDAVVRLMETVQNIELEASLSPDDEAAVYGWGRRLAETLDAEGMLWPAMYAPAPAWSAIVDAVQPTLAPDWRVPDPMYQAVAALGLEGVEVDHVGPVSPTSILTPFFAGRWGLDAMPRARGGFALEARDGASDVLVMAFLLDQRGLAAEIVEGRRRSVELARSVPERPWMVYGEATGALVKSPKAKVLTSALRDPRVVDALRVQAKTTGDGAYAEAWVATKHRLFVLMASGPDLGPADLMRAIDPMLDDMRPTPGAELGLTPLREWIAQVRGVPDAVASEPSWQYRLHEAARRLASGHDTGCAEVFALRLTAGEVADRMGHAKAAFECAAVPQDLDVAALAIPHLSEVPAAPAVRIAAHAIDEGAHRLAVSILAKARPDPNLEVEVATLKVSALVKLGRWSEVEAVVRRVPVLPAGVRAYAGSAMVLAGWRGPGLRILGTVCPELSGEDRRKCLAFFR